MLVDGNLSISKQPWYEAAAGSPDLAEHEDFLGFNHCMATGAQGPTIALLGAYRLQGTYAETYGARIPGAISIVAIHTITGQVFFNGAEAAHATPISEVIQAAGQDDGEKRSAVEGHFNVDLGMQLGLPPEAGQYAVFLWLDDRVSTVELVQVPAGPDRQGKAEASEGGEEAIVVSEAPEPAAEPIVLTAGAPATGALGPAAFAGPEAEAKSALLTVLAMGYESRQVGAKSVPLPPLAFELKSCSFTADHTKLFDAEDASTKHFLTAFSMGKLAAPVALGGSAQ